MPAAHIAALADEAKQSVKESQRVEKSVPASYSQPRQMNNAFAVGKFVGRLQPLPPPLGTREALHSKLAVACAHANAVAESQLTRHGAATAGGS